MNPKLYKQQNQQTTLAGDECPALLIWYTGPGAATFTWNATKFTFNVDAAADTSVNTGGTVDGEITDAEAATLGAVVDLINADSDGYWHARLVGAFRDDDTTDLKEVTSSAVTANGIATGNGAKLGCVCWDTDDLDAGPRIACFGPEADDSLAGAARLSAGNPYRNRDIADDDLETIAPLKTMARLTRLKATLGDGGTGPLTIAVYSAAQGDTAATARLLYSRTFTEDTQAIEEFNPPAELQSDFGERLVVVASSGAAFDAVNVVAVGGYGDPGELAA